MPPGTSLMEDAAKAGEGEIVQDDESDEEEPPKPLEELGGVIVYDSQALLFGCPKVESYYAETRDDPNRRLDPYLLFSQEYVKTTGRSCGFNERPRDRDFNTDHERAIFRNMPKFSP